MIRELSERAIARLAHERTAVISTAASCGGWAMPVRYRTAGLVVECAVPRWADAAFNLEQDPNVLLVVLWDDPSGLCWLQYRGRAECSTTHDWTGLVPEGTGSARPDDLYLLVRVVPTRIDLVDEGRGWGVRETLDLA